MLSTSGHAASWRLEMGPADAMAARAVMMRVGKCMFAVVVVVWT